MTPLDPQSAAVEAELGAARERYASVCERVERACARAGRDPGSVTLVGACKRQSAERIAATVLAGLSELGENYVQETADLAPRVAALVGSRADAPRWRLIGHLQSNKARAAAELFDAVDTVDRVKLARALDRQAGARGGVLDVCLQVNLSGESQKSGAAPDDVEALLDACRALPHLRVVGLMTMPAANPDPEAARPTFAQLRVLRDTLRTSPEDLPNLSMGMSLDFEVAIEEGATHVRVGTALFGERPPAA